MQENGFVIGFFTGATVIAITAIFALRAAWQNGVTDGFGHAKEPLNRGYWKAGDYLKENMGHRWPELTEEYEPGDYK